MMLNNLSIDRYQRLKALQVQKEKIVHEMFQEDLDDKVKQSLKL